MGILIPTWASSSQINTKKIKKLKKSYIISVIKKYFSYKANAGQQILRSCPVKS